MSYWQVFRPHGAGECWPAKQVFEVVRHELKGFEHAGGVSLANFNIQKKDSVMYRLTALKGMKPNTSYPTMTVSKFLHFFNPSLFPIYDTAVIWNKVFARFGGEYRGFCNTANLDSSADGAAFLRNLYLLGKFTDDDRRAGFHGILRGLAWR